MDDDGFETVYVFPRDVHRDKFSVEVEGTVKRVYKVDAESSAKATELARGEFFLEFGGDKEAVQVNDVWKRND